MPSAHRGSWATMLLATSSVASAPSISTHGRVGGAEECASTPAGGWRWATVSPMPRTAPHRPTTTSDASAICWDDISARRSQRRASSTSFAADEAIGLASLRKNASLPRAPSATRPGGSRPRSRIRAVDVDAASSLRGALVHLLELGRHDALAAPRGIFVPRSRDTRHHCRNCRLPLSPSYSPRASAFLGRLVLSW